MQNSMPQAASRSPNQSWHAIIRNPMRRTKEKIQPKAAASHSHCGLHKRNDGAQDTRMLSSKCAFGYDMAVATDANVQSDVHQSMRRVQQVSRPQAISIESPAKGCRPVATKCAHKDLQQRGKLARRACSFADRKRKKTRRYNLSLIEVQWPLQC
jgi:hypothetical protein